MRKFNHSQHQVSTLTIFIVSWTFIIIIHKWRSSLHIPSFVINNCLFVIHYLVVVIKQSPFMNYYLLFLLFSLYVKINSSIPCIHLSIPHNIHLFYISICPFGTGIVFHNYNGSDLSYTLRLRHETPTELPGAKKWFTQLRSPRFYPTGPRVYDKYKINDIFDLYNENFLFHYFSAYLNEGFLHLEHIVGQALIQFKTGSWPNLPSVEVRVSAISFINL